jgi:hypothetical protein
MMDASFGSLFFFEALKCGRRIKAKPPVLGAILRFGGYLWWRLTNSKPVLRPEQVAWIRHEQRAKMRRRLA